MTCRLFWGWSHRYAMSQITLKPERRAKIIGDNGVTLCYLPRSPFMLMVALYSGIQNLVYLDLDAPEEFAATMELLEAKADEAAQIALESPAECWMIPEPVIGSWLPAITPSICSPMRGNG